jgi:hypothetical protein
VKIHSNLHVLTVCEFNGRQMDHVCVKIMQIFVKLSYFFRQITTKTGNLICDFIDNVTYKHNVEYV